MGYEGDPEMTAPVQTPRKPKAVRSRILKFRATPSEEVRVLRDARRAGKTLTSFLRERAGLRP